MLGKTHATAGFCLGVVLSATASPAGAAIIIGEAVLGSLAPDIDHKNSTISKKLRPVGFVASAVAGHRTLFHNAFAYAAAFAALWYFVKPTAVFLIPFFAGIASHLLLDALNPMGIPEESIWRISMPGPRSKTFCEGCLKSCVLPPCCGMQWGRFVCCKEAFLMVYLVDLENVPYGWAEYFDGATADDEFILFYGKMGPAHLSFALLQALMEGPAKVRCVPCYDGDNAMDVQLCSELGYHIAKHGSCNYAIISKDKGYDSVVKHWRDLNVPIKQVVPQVLDEKALNAILPKAYLSVLATAPPSKKKKAATMAPVKIPVNKAVKGPLNPTAPSQNAKKKPPAAAYHEALKKANSGIPGPSLQSISTMMEKSLSVDPNRRLFGIYTMMCKKFKGNGRPYYNKLKSVISMVATEESPAAKAS